MSIGLLAFCFDKEVFSVMRICLRSCEIDWALTLNFASLLFLMIAVLYGLAVLVSRLFDFRITRNIALARQRFYEQNKDSVANDNSKSASLPDFEFPYPTLMERSRALLLVVFSEIQLLTKDNALKIREDELLRCKFNELRKLSFILGTISWRLPRYQAIYLGVATILYVLSLWVG